MINTSTHNVSATITVGSDPWGVAVSPNGQYVYVASYVKAVGNFNTVGTYCAEVYGTSAAAKDALIGRVPLLFTPAAK